MELLLSAYYEPSPALVLKVISCSISSNSIIALHLPPDVRGEAIAGGDATPVRQSVLGYRLVEA
jgi:hypothetical protein